MGVAHSPQPSSRSVKDTGRLRAGGRLTVAYAPVKVQRCNLGFAGYEMRARHG